jgi:hypothetical protein
VTVTPDGKRITVNIPGGSNKSTPAPNTPYVQSLELINGELIVTYGDSTTENLGDLLGLDGGSF